MNTSRSDVAFLFDVDNTLLDNDCVVDDLRRHLAGELGTECGQHYWRLFDQLRAELGYAEYMGANRSRQDHLACRRLAQPGPD